MKVFCFPYAGGIAKIIYSHWMKLIDDFEIIPIEMPDRNSTSYQTNYHSIHEAVTTIHENIRNLLTGSFIFWGHSMGAKLAFELAHKCRCSGDVIPIHLLLTGTLPFHVPQCLNPLFLLPDDEFFNEVFSLNGTSSNVLENQDIQNYFLPFLKKDFELCYTYQFMHEATPLKIPLTIVNGSEERPQYDREVWSSLTESRITVSTMPGDHFFLFRNSNELSDTLRAIINLHNHSDNSQLPSACDGLSLR